MAKNLHIIDNNTIDLALQKAARVEWENFKLQSEERTLRIIRADIMGSESLEYRIA